MNNDFKMHLTAFTYEVGYVVKETPEDVSSQYDILLRNC